MPVHTTLDSALAAVDAFDGAPQDFSLSIDESLLDPVAFSMALVTDRIFARGGCPTASNRATAIESFGIASPDAVGHKWPIAADGFPSVR